MTLATEEIIYLDNDMDLVVGMVKKQVKLESYLGTESEVDSHARRPTSFAKTSSPPKKCRMSDEARKRLSERMRKDNPAKRPEVREKISKALKGRVSTFKGHKFPESAKEVLRQKAIERCKDPGYRRKMSEAHKGIPNVWKGKKLPTETRIKISKARQEGYQNGTIVNYQQGKTLEEVYGEEKAREMKEKISEGLKKYYKDNPQLIPIIRERQRIVRSKMKIPYKDTKIEMKVKKALHDRGINNWLSHVPIYDMAYYHQPDIFFPELNPPLIVECDGCFWHGCEERIKYKKEVFLDKIIKRDKRIDDEYKRLGFKVVRLWEHDINDDLEGCIDRILEALNEVSSY